MSMCQIEEMNAHHAYPRSCPTCGDSGKCVKRLVLKPAEAQALADPYQPKGPQHMRQNLFAHTANGVVSYPEYISINREADGRVTMSVRGVPKDGREAPTVTVDLAPVVRAEMARALAA